MSHVENHGVLSAFDYTDVLVAGVANAPCCWNMIAKRACMWDRRVCMLDMWPESPLQRLQMFSFGPAAACRSSSHAVALKISKPRREARSSYGVAKVGCLGIVLDSRRQREPAFQ
ncbi:unnamed protein product [Effrenium voratum]|nr:unnamed protein product [Effrenium voratum]